MSTLSRTTRHNRLPFVWQQMKVQLHMRSLQLFSFGLIVTQPVIFSAVGYFLARAAGRTQVDLIHTIIGSGVMGMWSTLLFMSFYELHADRREGTLEPLVGSPTALFSILSIRVLTNVLFGGLSFLLSVMAAFLIFDFSPPFVNLPYILLSLGVQLFGFWCVGIFLAHWSMVSRLTGYFVNFLELPVGLLTGFLFPVSLLPGWAQKLSWFTPMSWAFNGLSASLQAGVDVPRLAGNLLVSLGVAGFYLSMTLLMSRRLQDMIRVTGELSSV
jgi:ABC-2 type transport system permease protein